MRFHIITLFPDSLRAYLNESILGRAQKKGIISVSYYNPRDFTKDKWARVDRRPYGGGPGMVLESESILKAAEKASGRTQAIREKRKKKTKIFFLSPTGTQLTNEYARKLVKKYDDIIIISGRYEGIDARVKKILRAEALTVGPYVLTGGELPAMIVVDVLSRQISGVLGKFESLEEERVASVDVYTRPEVLLWKGKKYRVPKILLTGDHQKIDEWKKKTNMDTTSLKK